MTVDMRRIQGHLKTFDFKTLFVEALGWDILREPPLIVTVDSQTYTLRPLVEKRGVKVYLCDPDASGKIPTDTTLRKIEREVTKYAYEHILIYVDAAKVQQVWQWVKREEGKPVTARYERLHKRQSGELLAQKVERLAFSIQEEEQLLTATVSGRVRSAFDVERVTRRFYERFKVELARFLTFIEGITATADREWYASLMLNRLMFVYFIQRKGFLATSSTDKLDGDTNYLPNRLRIMQEQYGDKRQDTFYSFYRYFLLKLFHDGLSKRDHSPELEKLLGKVPYLNGGLFDVHELERDNPDIAIPDEAFEKLFAFFDEFDWHLDDRPLKSGNEINPDVLGYIFEKYINQKQMGAYYTKEDITDYISKNTILPYLFEAAEQRCLVAFEANGPVWSLLRDNPDRYIYDAVKKGCELALPSDIEVGIADVTKRDEWNRAAAPEYALPTEIWREVVARRHSVAEVKGKLAAGAITSINDLITYNLDITRFAQDVIMYCEGPHELRAFYDSIEKVTVLDPTCGSGAFLFAALNILEPLYEACLDRMQTLVEERDLLDSALKPQQRINRPDINRFRDILAHVAKHPNRPYFILKSIIINNLYGVDIMEEATEICKLRLFLKLVSQVQQLNHIEPLPDIDFNIRAGNTLVGFATYAEAEQAITSKFDFDNVMERIEQKAKEIERSFANFRALQTTLQIDAEAMAAMKQQIREQLKALNAELHRYLASEYGIDRKNILHKEDYEKRFKEWQEGHQPFHWFVEFYRIMQDGGFDVIIGNPPYLEQREVNYVLPSYKSKESGAIHAMCIERSLQLLHLQGCMSMIVPLALVSTQRMKVVQDLLEMHGSAWYANYSWRPSKLFDTVNRALTIFLVTPTKQKQVFSTNYQKWNSDNREMLMQRMHYTEVLRQRPAFWIPKLGNDIELTILEKCLQMKAVLRKFMLNNSNYRVYYRTTGGLYWKVFTNFPPAFKVNGKIGHSTRETGFTLANERMILSVIAILSSNFFWWWYTITTNCRDLNPYDIQNFPVSESILYDPLLINLGKKYVEDLQRNSTTLVRNQQRTGHTETQSFKIQKSKPIIDEIDRVLAQHYGFTDEELDFIINYDIKYRMGKDSGDEGEE